jgi:hypothetical protein
MFKITVQFQHTVKDKTGYFYCENDTPFESTKEMLFQFQKLVGQLEDQVKAQAQAAEDAKKAEEAKSKIEPITEAENVKS